MSLISSHGYVKVYVGRGHHLSDSKGYAYEHRVVAERILGRPLRDGEQVHHKDGRKTNNDPSNIEVQHDIEHHAVFHRKGGKDLQMPGEENRVVSCSCGCGAELYRYDQWGRPRDFITGHNVGRNCRTGRFEVRNEMVG
jgi:hypothetical protein